MSLKKAVLISCFNYYDIRLKHVEKHLQDNQYEVIYITSDYDHIAKEPYSIERAGTVQVHAKPYLVNLSLRRMLSHFVWARDTFKQVKTIRPDLLFVMLPPNSLARHAAKYRKRNDAKLVFDIYDLWPETYPLPRNPLIKYPFYLWKNMRDKYLKYADIVTTECELYQEKLSITLKGIRVATLYPALDDMPVQREMVWDDDIVHLAFLGSINNIIDIPLIVKLITAIGKNKPVHLHIIGTGENKDEFSTAVKESGATVTDYGAIYDPQRKQDILDRCRFGLNIMRDSVCVGLTMKSIDYFRSSLPIINSIPADTAELVETREIGWTIGQVDDIGKRIAFITLQEMELMSRRVRATYCDIFSSTAFRKRAAEIFSDL